MHLDYHLDERLPILKSVVLGLQWAVVATSLIIILGKVAAAVHTDQPLDQITYLQKLFFVTAISILIQLLWGHKLPVISGPATVVLLGVLSSQAASVDAVYTAVMAGGVLLSIVTLTGLFNLESTGPRAHSEEEALRQTQEAITAVLNGERWIELAPASSYIRRLQHQMVRQANLLSYSYGKDPHRRVRVYRE